MNKLTMFVLAALAAATAAFGALAAAPSASAAPPSCSEIYRLGNNAQEIYNLLSWAGYGGTYTAASYRQDAKDYYAAAHRLGC
jgi:hypothetical protein